MASTSTTVEMLSKQNINSFFNTPVKVLCEPIAGLDEGLGVVSLCEKHLQTFERKGVSSFVELAKADVVIQSRKSNVFDLDNQDLTNIYVYLKSLEVKFKDRPSNWRVMLEFYFLQLVLYGFKNRVSDFVFKIALLKRGCRI